MAAGPGGEEIAFQEPDTEDWGWYSTVAWKGRACLLGAMAAEREAGGCDWMFQVGKHRTLMEKLLGREKMTHGDECFRFFLAVLENEPEFYDVAME
ncbi:MAG: hypothetical protein ACLFRG_10180 [Desulfococcaceae bacterium]